MASLPTKPLKQYFEPVAKRQKLGSEERDEEVKNSEVDPSKLAEVIIEIDDEGSEEECVQEEETKDSSTLAEVVIEIDDEGSEQEYVQEEETKNSSTLAEGVIEIDDEGSEGECVQEEETKDSSTVKKENPFACFSCQSINQVIPPKKESRFQNWSASSNRFNNRKVEKEKKGKINTCIKMADVSAEERERMMKKWHSLVDPAAPLEVKRFQLLVAARLHARCQQPAVHKAMNRLRDAFPNTLNVNTVAAADPEVLASCISNVVHYNVKAQHIVKAAQQIKTRFGGKVPEDEKSLLELTGIGTVFADFLALINTREAHGLELKEV
jgi:endonuclease III